MNARVLLPAACVSLACVVSMSRAVVHNLTPADDWYSVINGEALQPGDEVVLAGGTYVTADDKMLNIAHVGTADQPIVIRSADGATAVITRNTFGAFNDYYQNLQHNVINMRGAQYVTLRGLEITGGNWAVRIGSKTDGVYISPQLPMGNILRPARNITIEYCHIHHVHNTAISANFPGDVYDGLVFRHNEIDHTARYGESFYLGNYDDASRTIFAVARHCVVEGNYLHDQVWVGSWYQDPAVSYHGTGVQIKDGSYDNIIRDNVIHYTKYPAILVSGATPSAFSAGDTVGPNLIERNVIWQISQAPSDITGQGIQCAADTVLRNNIVYAPQPLQIQTHHLSTPHAIDVVNNTFISTSNYTVNIANSPIGPVLIANNALYRPGSTSVITGSGSSSSWVTKVANVAIPDLAAALVDAAGLNFYPAVGSPLLGAASPVYQSVDDFNRMARNGDLTAGAYAYNSGGNPGWAVGAGFKPSVGDINADGQVDVVDLLYLVGAFGTSLGDPAYDPACDFNADNTVDVVDLLDLVGNFGK